MDNNVALDNKSIVGRKVPFKQRQIYIVLRQLSKNKSAIIGLCLIVVLLLMAIFAEVLAPYDYTKQSLTEAYQHPSAKHLLGTDQLGRDYLSRLLVGSRVSLGIGLLASLIGAVVGLTIGAIAGYCGGTVDMLLMRFLDIYSSIPHNLISIVLAAVMGPGFLNCVIAISLGKIAGNAKMLRAQFLAQRAKEYVEAARVTGCSPARIIVKYIFPNAISPLIVNISMGMGTLILQASSLSFIGLGIQPPTPEWGAMLSEARSYMRDAAYLVYFPGILLMITVLAYNTFGDGLRDALDPRLRN